jgi:hypothetical protein
VRQSAVGSRQSAVGSRQSKWNPACSEMQKGTNPGSSLLLCPRYRQGEFRSPFGGPNSALLRAGALGGRPRLEKSEQHGFHWISLWKCFVGPACTLIREPEEVRHLLACNAGPAWRPEISHYFQCLNQKRAGHGPALELRIVALRMLLTTCRAHDRILVRSCVPRLARRRTRRTGRRWRRP